MNVDQLRRILTNLPGRLPVVVEDSSAGWMQGAGLYLAPAHFDCRVSGTFLYAGHQEGPDDCQALVISAFNQSNPDYLEITEPATWTPTVDAEVDLAETKETGGRSAISAPPSTGDSESRSRDQQVDESFPCRDLSPSPINERRGARQ
jgi:hypothetical protein